MKITQFNNGIQVRIKNKNIGVYKENDKVVLGFKSLTKETTFIKGCDHGLSKNGKIKYTRLGLQDDALEALYIALEKYFEHIHKQDKKNTN